MRPLHDQRHAGQRLVGVVALQDAMVVAHIVAVIGSIDHQRPVVQAAGLQPFDHAPHLLVDLRDGRIVAGHHPPKAVARQPRVVKVAPAEGRVLRRDLVRPAGKERQVARVIHAGPARRRVEGMMRFDKAHHQQVAARTPSRERLHGAVADPGGRVKLLGQVRGQRAERLPVLRPGRLPIGAHLVLEVVPVHQAVRAQIAVIVVIEPAVAILLGEHQILKADVGISRGKVHFADGARPVACLGEQRREGDRPGQHRAAVRRAAVLVHVQAGQQ